VTFDPGHLGERLSALVDGELDHDTRDRLLAHLAGCAECRAEVDDERRLKARLGGLADPEMPAELLVRLHAVAQTTAPPRDVAATAPTAPSRPRSRRDSSRPATRGGRRRLVRRTRVAALGTGGLLAAAMTFAFVIGGGAASGQAVTPSVDRLTVEHAAVTSDVPLTGPATTAVNASFARSGSP
jgi:anti-sigma factor RsiW